MIVPIFYYGISNAGHTLLSFVFSCCIATLFLVVYFFIDLLFNSVIKNENVLKKITLTLKIILFILMGLHIVICGADFVMYLWFGQRLSYNILFVIFETTFSESIGFIDLYSNTPLKIVMLLLFAAFPFLARFLL